MKDIDFWAKNDRVRLDQQLPTRGCNEYQLADRNHPAGWRRGSALGARGSPACGPAPPRTRRTSPTGCGGSRRKASTNLPEEGSELEHGPFQPAARGKTRGGAPALPLHPDPARTHDVARPPRQLREVRANRNGRLQLQRTWTRNRRPTPGRRAQGGRMPCGPTEDGAAPLRDFPGRADWRREHYGWGSSRYGSRTWLPEDSTERQGRNSADNDPQRSPELRYPRSRSLRSPSPRCYHGRPDDRDRGGPAAIGHRETGDGGAAPRTPNDGMDTQEGLTPPPRACDARESFIHQPTAPQTSRATTRRSPTAPCPATSVPRGGNPSAQQKKLSSFEGSFFLYFFTEICFQDNHGRFFIHTRLPSHIVCFVC